MKRRGVKVQLQDLVIDYTPVGDVIALITCIVLAELIWESKSDSRDHNFDIFKMSVYLLSVAAISNVMFYMIITYWPTHVESVYITRAVYHDLLLFNLLMYIIYVRNLMVLPAKNGRRIAAVSCLILFSGILFDTISPLIKFGFYLDDEGLWHDTTYIKPFTIAYIGGLLILLYMIIRYKDRLITQLRRTFMFMGIFCAITLVIQNMFNNNSYMTFTFIIPVIGVFVMIHSHPYELATGAMGLNALGDFIAATNRHGNRASFLSIRFLDTDRTSGVPQELGKAIHTFWMRNYKQAKLFKTDEHTYVLAIEERLDAGENESLMVHYNHLINNVFPEYYKKFKIPYKIVAFEPSYYMRDYLDFVAAFAYYDARMEENSYIFVGKKDIDKLARIRYILDEINDICLNRNSDDERVVVYAQPILSVATGKYEYAEMLMRLDLEKTGLIEPSEFMSFAHEFDFVHELSLIVLNKTCRCLSQMLDGGCRFNRFTVNFSVEDLVKKDFADEVQKIMWKHHIPSGKLSLEITESNDAKMYERVKNTMDVLCAENVHFVLDDFGVGYSNFADVTELNFDVVKFDRRLLIKARENEKVASNIRTLVTGFKNCGIKVLFEGVEDASDERMCVMFGADYLQGYKYSRPVPVLKIKEFFI